MKTIGTRRLALARFAPALLAASLLLAHGGVVPAQTDPAPAESSTTELAQARRKIIEEAREEAASANHQSPLEEGERLPGYFRLASYNVELLFDDVDDPVIEDENFEEKPAERLEALAKVIRAMDPDILGVQEIEHGRALKRFVDNYLADAGYTIYMDEPENSMFNVALLSRYPVKRAVRYGDSEDGAEAFKYLRHRIVAFEVEVAPDYTMWAVVCHWKASGDPRSREMREEMALATRELVLNRLGLDPKKDNIAILGDFNDTPESKPLALLVGTEDWFVDLGRTTQNVELTHPSRDPGRQIDYIVVSYGLGCEQLAFKSPPVPDLETLALASDHLPVMGVFFDRENGFDAEAKKKTFMQTTLESRVRLMEVSTWNGASDAIRAKGDRDMAQALSETAGLSTSIAKARADFEALRANGEDAKSPIVAIEGVVLTPPGVIGGRRVQFGFSDISGGILVDAPNARLFPKIPEKGERLRLVGKVIPYREILEFRPYAEPENYGPAAFPPAPPALTVAEFAANAQRYVGGRVMLEDGVARKVERQENGGVKYTFGSSSGARETVVVFVDGALPNAPPKVVGGQKALVSGLVSKFRETYQILALEPDDILPLDEPDGSGIGYQGAAPGADAIRVVPLPPLGTSKTTPPPTDVFKDMPAVESKPVEKKERPANP